MKEVHEYISSTCTEDEDTNQSDEEAADNQISIINCVRNTKQNISTKRIFSSDDSATSESDSPVKKTSATAVSTSIDNLEVFKSCPVKSLFGDESPIESVAPVLDKACNEKIPENTKKHRKDEKFSQHTQKKKHEQESETDKPARNKETKKSPKNKMSANSGKKNEKVKKNQKAELNGKHTKKEKIEKSIKIEVSEEIQKKNKKESDKKPKKRAQIKAENKNVCKETKQNKCEKLMKSSKASKQCQNLSKLFNSKSQENAKKQTEKSDTKLFPSCTKSKNDLEIKSMSYDGHGHAATETYIQKNEPFGKADINKDMTIDDIDSDNSAKIKSDIYKNPAHDDIFDKLSDLSHTDVSNNSTATIEKSKRPKQRDAKSKRIFKSNPVKRNSNLPKGYGIYTETESTDESSCEESISFSQPKFQNNHNSSNSCDRKSAKARESRKTVNVIKMNESIQIKSEKSLKASNQPKSDLFSKKSESTKSSLFSPKKTESHIKTELFVRNKEIPKSTPETPVKVKPLESKVLALEKKTKNAVLRLSRLPWFSGDISADTGTKVKQNASPNQFSEKIVDSCFGGKFKVRRSLMCIRNLKLKVNGHYTLQLEIGEDLLVENRKRIEAIFFTSFNKEGKVCSIREYPFLQVVQNGMPVDAFDSLQLGYWLPFPVNGINRLDLFTGSNIPPNPIHVFCFTLSKRNQKMVK